MGSKNKKTSSIEDLLREKARIEKSINEQFQDHVTIMFTDIAGYTSFVETHGDITAKSLLQTHNEIIFPIIEKHSGSIIKTIGDAIMASFVHTENAVNAAVDIQKALKLYNATAEKVQKINIRIGIHAGNALKDGNDYFGDAVNIAARIEPACSAGQIMVSKSVYETVKGCDHIFLSYHSQKKAKGKSEPIDIYQVFLDRDEQLSFKKPPEEKESGNNTITDSVKPVTNYNLMWKISLPFVLVLVLLFIIYPGFFKKIYNSSDKKIEKYMDGFMHLRNGDFETAKKQFLDIGKDDPKSYEGLAAVAYRNQKYDQADRFSNKSLQLNTGTLYPRVIKGNILFDNGKYQQAEKLYNKATDLDSLLKWQKGEAFFRLGRIYSFKDDLSKALEFYNQAGMYDEQNADILTAKGILLEKMGEMTQALELFQNARNLAPDNALARAFHQNIQQKIQAEQDRKQQERIDTLIDELLSSMKNNKPAKRSDRWTSRPVPLFFANMERKGIIPLQEGADDFFKLEMTERLRSLPSVDVVDRELLDKLLEELKLSSSSLADSATALKLGKIMSARLIGNLTFIGLPHQTRVYLKLIETETSAVKISLSEKFENHADPDKIINMLVNRVAEQIKKAFPVRGKISSQDGRKVLINIGSKMGVQKGMIMRVLSSDKTKKLVGAVKVVSVSPDKAKGEIVKQVETINRQYLVEAPAL